MNDECLTVTSNVNIKVHTTGIHFADLEFSAFFQAYRTTKFAVHVNMFPCRGNCKYLRVYGPAVCNRVHCFRA